MQETEAVLKTVAEGLKGLAQGMDAIAGKIDELSNVQKTAKSAASQPAKSKARPAKKAAGVGKPGTAIDDVYQIVSRSIKGVTTAALKDKTGFDDKKVSNIIYKLKKQGRIKSIDKGVYLKN
jgi:predicted nucleic acid-binding protein